MPLTDTSSTPSAGGASPRDSSPRPGVDDNNAPPGRTPSSSRADNASFDGTCILRPKERARMGVGTSFVGHLSSPPLASTSCRYICRSSGPIESARLSIAAPARSGPANDCALRSARIDRSDGRVGAPRRAGDGVPVPCVETVTAESGESWAPDACPDIGPPPSSTGSYDSRVMGEPSAPTGTGESPCAGLPSSPFFFLNHGGRSGLPFLADALLPRAPPEPGVDAGDPPAPPEPTVSGEPGKPAPPSSEKNFLPGDGKGLAGASARSPPPRLDPSGA
mmetsp:Transcript_27959/g.96628  ORF Transcript_27959/g.96628 Transcript_27959/m.96628 type:complete len:278 (+) Transcript_27959:1187-2020(+)